MAEPVVVTENFEGFYRRAWHDAARWATALTGDAATGEEIAQDCRGSPHFRRGKSCIEGSHFA